MTELSKTSCEACRADAPILSEKEIKDLLAQLSSWNLNEGDGVKKLVCSYAFLSYEDSIAFANNVAKLAEQEDHHPEIILEWGKVTVSWWSHKIKGLHMNDFICASKTDVIFEELK